jgi:CPA2 family monovalent cation:H+ antiporter-2
MEEVVLISCMAILIVLAVVCSTLLSRVNMPPLIGFLVAGILIANLNLFTDEGAMDVVEVFSHLGLIMLMFAIGMEIDVRKMKQKGTLAITVAAVQLPLMLVGGMIGGFILGFNFVQCITLGAIISGSSTAVVMAVLKSQGTLDVEHIEMLVLITIMEDIGQVIMLSMLTPLLSGSNMDPIELVILIIKIAIFMVLCFGVGLKVVPRVVDWLSNYINDELTALLCVGMAFVLAFAAYLMGLSVAIGAFLMGVMIASTVKKHVVEHFVDPLKSLFMAMFFISVGMEVTFQGLVDNILLIIIFYLLFAALKSSTVFLGYWIGNEKPRDGYMSAVALCAMGEFAFIIAKQALDYNVVDQAFYSSVIGAALISMVMLPILTRNSARIWDGAEKRSPQSLRNFCSRFNAKRSNFYASLNGMTGKARDMFNSGIGRVYVDVLAIIIIEAVCYYGYPYAFDWMNENLTGLPRYWDFVLMSLNFWLLFVPCKSIIEQMSILKPYSFVLEDDDHEVAEELYLVDDDIVIINKELMGNLGKDLDEFLEKLLKD